MSPPSFTIPSRLKRTINYDINQVIFDLHGKVDYVIADYSHIDEDLWDAIVQKQSLTGLFQQVNQYLKRERGIRAACDIDQIASHEAKTLRTQDIVDVSANKRQTKILLKLNAPLAKQVNGLKLSDYFSGLMLESNDAAELSEFVRAFPVAKDPSLNNICLLRTRPENAEGLLESGYCNHVVIDIDFARKHKSNSL